MHNSKSIPSKEVLIIGGGLTGVFLAAESLKAGHSVTLIDQPAPATATRVAAGLYNIITGRKATLTWQAELLLETLADFFALPPFDRLSRYREPYTIYRPFREPAAYNEWTAKALDPAYARHVAFSPQERLPEQLHNPLGGLEILPCGWLDTRGFTAAALELMKTEMGLILHRGQMDYAALQPSTGKANIGGREHVYDEVICAEGVRVKDNPWWGWLDIRPLKGQILEVEIPGLELDFVLLRKAFFLPKGNSFYTVGSTYEKYFKGPGPTAEGIEELSQLIRAAVKLPFRVAEARAGIRPTTPNRRPVWGRHPEHARLYVLNGMGAKGVLQAPWSAKRMRAWLDGKETPIPRETGLERFLKKIS
ncbi:MAG: FAD-binding oxidoreductase [Bacteroidota bacterium]